MDLGCPASVSAGSVGSLVPTTFEAYGRVLHPAHGPAGAPIRWDEIAARSGRKMHRLAEFAAIAKPLGLRGGPAQFVERPEDGALVRPSLAALVETLAVHTATPDSCSVGVWEGRAWLGNEPVETACLELPERSHLIFEGPLVAVFDMGWSAPGGTSCMKRQTSCGQATERGSSRRMSILIRRT